MKFSRIFLTIFEFKSVTHRYALIPTLIPNIINQHVRLVVQFVSKNFPLVIVSICMYVYWRCIHTNSYNINSFDDKFIQKACTKNIRKSNVFISWVAYQITSFELCRRIVATNANRIPIDIKLTKLFWIQIETAFISSSRFLLFLYHTYIVNADFFCNWIFLALDLNWCRRIYFF